MKIPSNELRARLEGLPQWAFVPERGGVISRTFVFTDFGEAFGFMAQVALYAEKHNHHPEWSNVYNKVSVTLTTHDVDGVSMKDIDMASYMNRIAA